MITNTKMRRVSPVGKVISSRRQRLHLAAAMVLMLVGMLVPQGAWADNGGLEEAFVGGKTFYVLRNTNDWNDFCQKVEEAKTGYDVNAIMDADFEVARICGSFNSQFRGIFDGNGHTLDAKISTTEVGALFMWSNDAIFRNLHVTGTISSGRDAGGIVGYGYYNRSIQFDKVWVSATIKTTSTGWVSGFMVYTNNVRVSMTNCRFDGTLNSTKSDTHFAAFIGYGSGSWSQRCIYENCTYSGSSQYSMNWVTSYSGGSTVYERWSGQDRCISAHNQTEIPSDCRNVTEQNTVVSKMNVNGAADWQVYNEKAVPKCSYPMGDVNFDTYDMVLGTENGEEGMLKIPFSCDQAVKWIGGSYTDENGTTRAIDGISFKQNTYASFIKVPATDQHKNIKLNIVLANGYTILGHEMKDDNDVVMHKALNLTVTPLNFSTHKVLTDAGALELTWTVSNADYKDAVDGDQFVVMRSFTDNTADMQNIGSVLFDSNITNYTFKDSTITSALTEAQLNGGSVTAHYIVIRASAKELWGLSNNVTSATQSQALNNLHLLKVNTDYEAEWKDQTARTISVTWSYGTEDGAVWDSRAQMKLLLTSVNRNNEPVDTTTYVLTTDEMQACKKELTLNRSCVYYNLEFVTELGSTVTHYKAQNKSITINTTADWNTFVNMVTEAQGKYKVNAWLMADISVENQAGIDSNAPYRGTFEGNGHTLTVTITGNQQCNAPFRYVSNATLRNLHTTGTITTSQKFAGGLVSRVLDNGSLLVDGCHVSVDINSSVNGDATNGGIVALGNNGTTITLRNSKFDGKLRGANCYANGGMVGYSTGQVNIESSLFAPAEISTNIYGCETWSRTGGSGKVTTTNCQCTREYRRLQTVYIQYGNGHGDFNIIRNADDWETLRDMVNHGESPNAILANDITVNSMLGESPDRPCRSVIFFGNGHTLTVNIDNGSGEYTAPFGYVDNFFAIRDLHVAGSVKGGNYSSGLIGNVSTLLYTDINRVCVSTNVTTTGNHLGGFIGNINKSKIYIENSRFDGSLTAPSGTESYGGAFIGWGDNNEFMYPYRLYEDGTYTNIRHAGYNYRSTGEAYIFTSSSISSHDWGEVESRYRNITDQNSVRSYLSWKMVDGKAEPEMKTYELPDALPVLSDDELLVALGDGWTKDASGKPVPKTSAIEPPTDDIYLGEFYYENLGHINKQSLATETRPTSVLLTWENETDEPVDYYEIHRYDKQQAKWDTIATQLTDMQYEDKATSPVHQYIYKVRGVTSCEGLTYDETKEVEGMCVQTASVEGHLCFLDGTGIPGKKVFISVGNTEMPDFTDESGFFRIEGIPYKDGQETSYNLSVVGINGLDPVLVTFGTEPSITN